MNKNIRSAIQILVALGFVGTTAVQARIEDRRLDLLDTRSVMPPGELPSGTPRTRVQPVTPPTVRRPTTTTTPRSPWGTVPRQTVPTVNQGVGDRPWVNRAQPFSQAAQGSFYGNTFDAAGFRDRTPEATNRSPNVTGIQANDATWRRNADTAMNATQQGRELNTRRNELNEMQRKDGFAYQRTEYMGIQFRQAANGDRIATVTDSMYVGGGTDVTKDRGFLRGSGQEMTMAQLRTRLQEGGIAPGQIDQIFATARDGSSANITRDFRQGPGRQTASSDLITLNNANGQVIGGSTAFREGGETQTALIDGSSNVEGTRRGTNGRVEGTGQVASVDEVAGSTSTGARDPVRSEPQAEPSTPTPITQAESTIAKDPVV